MSDTRFKRPILIYSSFCNFSNNFLKVLTEHPELYNSFIRMNIDVDENTRKRPEMFYKIQEILGRKISKVPTIITQDAEHILSDQDAFKWLEFQINTLTKSKDVELVGFTPDEMISFSDHYSKFGSTELNDANDQSYKFLVDVDNNGHTEKILPDDNYLNTNKNWTNDNNQFLNGFLNESDSNTQKIDNTSAESVNTYIPYHNDRQSINFTDRSFGNSNSKSSSTKSKELDDKLLLLQKDRENMDIILNKNRRI